MKPVKTFSESDQSPEFLLWGQNNWAFWDSNENKKQDWCESRGNLLTKWLKTWILTHLEAPNVPHIWATVAYILLTYKISFNELIEKIPVSP